MADERSTAERVVDATSFFLTRGGSRGRMVNPLTEERLRQKEEADASTQRKEKFKEAFMEQYVRKAFERGVEPAMLPDEVKIFYADRGIDITSLPGIPKEQDVNPTEFEESIAAVQRLEAQAAQAQRDGKDELADRLFARAQQARQIADRIANPEEKEDTAVINGRLVYKSGPKMGQVVASFPPQRGATEDKPSTSFVNVKMPDNTMRSYRASDPAIDDAISQGGIIVSRQGGMSIELDSDGKIRSIRQGGDNTIGETSRLQQETRALDATILEVAQLRHAIRGVDVGFVGLAGELVADKTLPQLGLDTADPERIQNRTLMLAVREKALRLMTTDSRFNIADRAAVEAMFPANGVFESEVSAKNKLLVLEQILKDRNEILGGRLGRKPISAMTPEEIKQNARTKTNPNGTIPYAVAERALELLHGYTR